MADEPQQTPPSNNSRITAMLQDLAAQRAAGTIPAPVRPQTPPQTRPQQPVASAPVGTPPTNLPITPPQRPAITAAPAPVAPHPVIPPSAEPKTPAVAPIPQPVSPPPAPKEAPVAPMPAVPRPPQPAPAPVMPTPVIPAPIPTPVAPPPVSQKEGYSAELRTMSADIGNIKVGQSPSGIRQVTPSAPVAPTIPAPSAPSAPIITPKSPSAPTIVVPSSSGGSSRKFIYLTIGAVVLIGITYVLVSMIGGSGPSTSPTPSASESSTPAPTLSGKSLRSYFGNPGATINLQSVVTGKADLTNGLVSVQPAAKQAISIAIQHQGKTATNASFFEDVIGGLPYHLTQSTADDWALLAFGQSEVYDASGTLSSDTNGGTRLIVIVEIIDATQVNQGMQAWEADDPAIGNLAATFAPIFSFDTTKKIVTGFSGGTYRQIPVRYWNFPYADHSIDYAIVTASNNKNYLVLAGSRQAIFFAIDQLMQ